MNTSKIHTGTTNLQLPLSVTIAAHRAGLVKHVDDYGAVGDYDPITGVGTDDTAAFQALINSGAETLSFEGGKHYKVTKELSPLRRITLLGGDSYLYQTDKTQSLFGLANCDGSIFYKGHYSHNMDISEYLQANGKLFFTNIPCSNVTFESVNVFRTAQQGIVFNRGGDNNRIINCLIENTARDGCFMLDCTNTLVQGCTFKNTGDDAISMAGSNFGHIVTGNSIIGGGTYNIGGSGIRSNGSGIIANNTIKNSQLFGIVAAVNSVDSNERPRRLSINDNLIEGILATDTTTGGIAIKECISVSCQGNDIYMPSKEAHAYRIYGSGDRTEELTISGGSVVNCKSLVYVREAGVMSLSIDNISVSDCDDSVLVELGDGSVINTLSIAGINSKSTTNASIFRISSGNLGSVSHISTSDNRIVTPSSVNYDYGGFSVDYHEAVNDQYPTNVFADSAGGDEVSYRSIHGRCGDKTYNNGSVTFNITNSGLIPLGLSSGLSVEGEDLNIVLRTTLGSASYWYVDYVDNTNFRIRLDSSPGADVTFDWEVKSYDYRVIR